MKNRVFRRTFISVVASVCVTGLSGCGGIPTGGQLLDIPKGFSSKNIDSVYIFTSGQRGKAMDDPSVKYIAIRVFDRADNVVGSLDTSCYCGPLSWNYSWKKNGALTIVFYETSLYETSQKGRSCERDLFTWRVKLGDSGSLVELDRIPPLGN